MSERQTDLSMDLFSRELEVSAVQVEPGRLRLRFSPKPAKANGDTPPVTAALPAEPYPGSEASAREILQLAKSYDAAATALKVSTARGSAVNWAPFRLCALHAIELYINAFLRAEGMPPEEIRARHHDLVSKAFARELGLSERTSDQLRAMTEGRHYLVVRYDPARMTTLGHPNSLVLCLREVREKVLARVGG